MLSNGATYDGAAYDGTAYDGTAYDGTTYDGTTYDGTWSFCFAVSGNGFTFAQIEGIRTSMIVMSSRFSPFSDWMGWDWGEDCRLDGLG